MKGLLLVSLLSLPQFVFAQDPGGLVTCSGPDCDFCDLVAMINGLISWLIGILTLVAVLILVYAGFKLVVSAGDTAAMADAKKLLTNVIIGFVIIMSAWLIVDTVMKALVAPSADFGVWNQISSDQCGGVNIPSTGYSG